VRAEGDNVRYLTPLKDASPLMSRSEENNASMAAAHALSKPNSFASKLDYTGSEVLVTSRSITGTPWALLVKVDRAEALAETAQWRNTVAAAFVLLLLAIIASIVAINARRSAAVAAEAASRATLLATVTNNQPEPLYIVDEQLAMQFANQQTASLVGVPAEELQGKSLANMMGQAFAEALRKPVQRALETKRPQTAMLTREEDGAPHAICARFVPMDSIPLEGLEDRAGVLVVEQDITEALREREKRLGTLQQLIGTLVSMVDRRDPNAAQHSSAGASVATAIAEEMNLDPVTVETTGTAARLMNLGKMDIPTEWLTRADKLSDKERLALRSTNLTSAELLEGIAFEGPVAETVRQSQEHVDGSGPLKLQGDTILISARIIAAANALVGMVSPRTYRAALPISEAETVLMQDSDTRFDRRVVIALMHYLDNRGGREALQTMMQVAAPARKNA
jgi:PAS domain S-box-containing protein